MQREKNALAGTRCSHAAEVCSSMSRRGYLTAPRGALVIGVALEHAGERAPSRPRSTAERNHGSAGTGRGGRAPNASTAGCRRRRSCSGPTRSGGRHASSTLGARAGARERQLRRWRGRVSRAVNSTGARSRTSRPTPSSAATAPAPPPARPTCRDECSSSSKGRQRRPRRLSRRRLGHAHLGRAKPRGRRSVGMGRAPARALKQAPSPQ